jgi:hypothetical protein
MRASFDLALCARVVEWAQGNLAAFGGRLLAL